MKANEREIHEDLIKSCTLLTWPAHARRRLVARGGQNFYNISGETCGLVTF